MVQLLKLLCIFASTQSSLAAILARSTAGSANGRAHATKSARAHASGSAAKWPGMMDLGLGSAGDLPVASSESSDMISVPGEGMIVDEMVALQKPDNLFPRSQAPSQQFLSSNAPKPVKPLAALATAQSQGLMSGASLDARSAEASSSSAASMATSGNEKVVEEYDVSDDDDQNDDYRTTKSEEVKTREELTRSARGDVENVKPAPRKKAPVVLKRRLQAAMQQKSKVVAKQAVAVEQDAGADKMMAQCMTFAGWVKGQGSTGPDLVRIWKGTCMPAVMAGTAPPAYGNMCNALGTAVSKFAVRPWAPADLCQAVLAVFKESGVGATPM